MFGKNARKWRERKQRAFSLGYAREAFASRGKRLGFAERPSQYRVYDKSFT